MSSSLSATPPLASSSTSGGSHLGGANRGAGSSSSVLPPGPAQFREIHKNTWLKRLSADGKKITVGPKKSERNWVVFCVHDDSSALLEGYVEPRQAASHMPEWIVSLQDTLHISHALIPNLHEFEFVVTLSNEVLRFHAMSWEVMQEWVETLRSKLREMKILSPRENLYTKLPEVRAPLLPTRDPTSPLPAPPPVPAAIVPGVERITAHQSTAQRDETAESARTTSTGTVNTTTSFAVVTGTASHSTVALDAGTTLTSSFNDTAATTTAGATIATMPGPPISTALTNLTAMSNTLTQNLLNMLSDPISTYSEQLNDTSETSAVASVEHDVGDEDIQEQFGSEQELNLSDDEFLSPLLRKACVLTEHGVRVDIGAGQRASADQLMSLEHLLECERLIPRPQTSRSMSAGAADKAKKPRRAIKNKVLPAKSSPPVQTTETTVAATSNTNAVNTNVTIIEVSTTHANNSDNANVKLCADGPQLLPPKLPTKTITGDIFRFPEIATKKPTTKPLKQHEYKSNVQIIPSNTNSSTIQVIGQCNAYTVPVKTTAQTMDIITTTTTSTTTTSKPAITTTAVTTASAALAANTTMVHVIGAANRMNSSTPTPITTTTTTATTTTTTTSVAVYGTCYTPTITPTLPATSMIMAGTHTPKLTKKVILTADTSGITNITINNEPELNTKPLTATTTTTTAASAAATAVISNHNATTTHMPHTESGDCDVKHNVGNVHYEKVFLSASIPVPSVPATDMTALQQEQQQLRQTNTNHHATNGSAWRSSPLRRQAGTNSTITIQQQQTVVTSGGIMDATESPAAVTRNAKIKTTTNKAQLNGSCSPALPRRRIVSPTQQQQQQQQQQSLPISQARPMLTRGLTEAVISTRPSRRDFHNLKLLHTPNKSATKSTHKSSSMANNNIENSTASSSGGSSNASTVTPVHAALNRTTAVEAAMEQRRRSSSTSDAQAPLQRTPQRGANNNEFPGGRNAAALRMQQPPQPYRTVEQLLVGSNALTAATNATSGAAPAASAATPKRLTLREQQVMQLRREIMHPGGVRLQLRRKDCLGSVAWVDAFGAIWIAGWKQKEHPVLYNALHIGDQLLSIAGVSISNAAEANKVIRNTNTLFLEVLVRRIPFGRAYAIRRDREGQCLGLIRDGNTSTIVDVVPNSLAARHGLPPKAQSCDGTTLTFWMLTEINGRPLNLYFKETEIRDRLNSVGRDISILVQPADLVTKLKKQLKSLRSYKEYLVQ